MLLTFLILYRSRKPLADADETITGSAFEILQTDVISETNMLTFTVSETYTKDSDGGPSLTESVHLTRLLTNILIRKRQEVAIETAGTPSRSPTPSIPKYFSPPLLVGISFAVVFIVGLIYTQCCIQTYIIAAPKDDDDNLVSDGELDDIDHNKSKKSRKSHKSKEKTNKVKPKEN